MRAGGERREAGLGLATELLFLVVVLVAGAALRYWLSTNVPFDEPEYGLLRRAANPSAGLRVPCIMLSGASLFLLYVVLRRSVGRAGAFAGLLALQTSVPFQVEAMRFRPVALPVILVVMVALTAWRLYRPPGKLPRAVALVLTAVAILLTARGAWLGATLPARLAALREESRADPDAFRASWLSCGGGPVVRATRLGECRLAWPQRRSLAQQEAGLEHARRVGAAARVVTSAAEVPQDGAHVLVLDAAAAAALVVPEGALVEIAARILGHGPDPT